jgi:hypothetical protein
MTPFWRENNWFRPKKGKRRKKQEQKRAHDLENQDASYAPR